MTEPRTFDHVNYDSLDAAKRAFIEASKRTLAFTAPFGCVVNPGLGASANVFSLDANAFLAGGGSALELSLVPEGLGTADDARPDDLTRTELLEFWFNIGVKTVSVLTNDLASGGLQPILLGLYLPSSTPESVFTPEFMEGFLDGVVDGCRTCQCSYFSGETPQLKSKIVPHKLDIAGAVFGARRPHPGRIDSSRFGPGNVIVLIESSGPHENGFTTLRGLAETLPHGYRTDIGEGVEYWRAINAPSKLYTPLVQRVLEEGISPTNLENITGHGWQKIMRSGRPLQYRITSVPEVLPVFRFVQKKLSLSDEQLFSVFNCGSGFALFTASESDANRVVEIAEELGLRGLVAGMVEASEARRVTIEPLGVTLHGDTFGLAK